MYHQKKETFGKYETITLANNEKGNAITIMPEFGANVLGLNLNHTPVIDGVIPPNNVATDTFYKSALLFPYPNRVRNGKYVFEGKEYEMNINEPSINTSLHGFLFNKPMKVVEITTSDKAAVIELQYEYKGEEKGYPFSAEVEVTYSLTNTRGFKCDIHVKNTGKTNMPFGFGWHPYLMLNTPTINDLDIKIPLSHKHRLDHQMIPTGEKSLFDSFSAGSSLANNFFDDCFLLQSVGEIAETTIYNKATQQKLILWQETGKNKFNYLQIFTPPHRKSIAIEPMTCAVDAFNNQEGLIILEPKQVFEGSFGIRIE
jgi:aldose 1-epimerase